MSAPISGEGSESLESCAANPTNCFKKTAGVCGYMYTCGYMWAYVGICGYMWVYMGMYIHVGIGGHMRLYVGICGYIWVYMSMCIHVYTCECMWVQVGIYGYMCFYEGSKSLAASPTYCFKKIAGVCGYV